MPERPKPFAPKDLVLEIGTEPLPARFLRPALEQLERGAAAALEESRLEHGAVKAFGTLRRLCLEVKALSGRSSALVREVQGPPARLLKDEQGRFTPQAEGFARKQGIAPEELGVVDTPKGPMLMARVISPGEPATAVLARLLPQLLTSLQFPKSMEWEASRLRFARPIRSLLALHGKDVIKFSVAGIRSGRNVFGLPSQGRKPVGMSEAGRFRQVLRGLSIIVDQDERRELLVRRLEAAAKAAGGRIDLDADLLEETVWLVEHPTPVAGAFKEEFLALPAALLSTSLKKQLKFFPLLKGAGLYPGFVGVRDGLSDGVSQVREGYQRVLTARFSDAAFFIKRDASSLLEDKLPALKGVGFQKGLGTMAERAERVCRLTEKLCEALGPLIPLQESAAQRIARLAYADLVCEVVKEFPELQGTIGGHYCRRDGEDERVSLGVEQFYFPVGAKSPVPAMPEGAVASLAGKLDALAGHFAVGLVPTGSADPYALRRGATGAVRIALEGQLPLDLRESLAAALELQTVAVEPARLPQLRAQLEEFLWTRAQSLFEEMGYAVDEIRAVSAGALENLPRTLMRLAALHAVRKNAEFSALAAAFKRASNILKGAKFTDGASLDRAQLDDEAEAGLFDAVTRIEGQVGERVSQQRYDEALRALALVKAPLDHFFDKVLVNAEDESLRRRRLALLSRLVGLFRSVADLSELQS